MTGLLDIRKRIVTHKIGDATINCHGITADGLTDLLGRFPSLKETIFPSSPRPAAMAVADAPDLMRQAPGAIAAILVAGTENEEGADPVELEKAARNLPVTDQIDLLTKILGLTIGEDGFVPFVQRVTAIFGAENPQAQLNVAVPPNGISSPNGKALDTGSPSQSTG